MTPEYKYKATVVRWVDGDTVDLRVDCGFYTFIETRFRLAAVDTPERGQDGYREAIGYVNNMAPVSSSVVIETFKSPDKYGRFLAFVYVETFNINIGLIDQGLAVPYGGS